MKPHGRRPPYGAILDDVIKAFDLDDDDDDDDSGVSWGTGSEFGQRPRDEWPEPQVTERPDGSGPLQ